LLITVVVPRPIAWVSTVDANGLRNLAPFSFFNAVSGSPPMLMLSISQRAGQMMGYVIRTAETLLVDDISTHPFVSSSSRARGQRRGVYAPLRWHDRVIEGLSANRPMSAPPFAPDDLRLLLLFADQAAVAIENARAHDALNQRVRELELIYDLVTALVRELRLERVYELVVEKAALLTGAETSAPCLLNESEETRTFLAAWGGMRRESRGRSCRRARDCTRRCTRPARRFCLTM